MTVARMRLLEGYLWVFWVVLSVSKSSFVVTAEGVKGLRSRRAQQRNRRTLWSRARNLLIIYNKNAQQLIAERHAFEPLEFNIGTGSPAPNSDAPTRAPDSAATDFPTAGPTLVPTPVRGDETVQEFLTRTLTDDGALESVGTPQNQAFVGLIADFPELDPNNGEEDKTLISEIYGLATLFYATSGASWRDRTLWPGPTRPCNIAQAWFGVTCELERVVAIELPTNDLLGELPSEIRALTNLGTLYAV